MNSLSIGYLAAAIIIAIGATVSAISIAIISREALKGIARQPEASDKIQNSLIIAIALAEAIAIYALVGGLLLIFTAK